jgi:type IV secretion system protein VirB11
MASVMNGETEGLQDERDRRIAEKLRRELGRDICGFLEEPDVVEIILNPDGKLWVERMGKPMVNFGRMMSHQAESIMTTVASVYKTTITRENPILECELPFDGSRFEALIPPVVAAPTFTIRRKALKIFTLADYVASSIMTERQCEIVKDAIRRHRNILVVGSTGSGKTTLTNALIDYIAEAFPAERLVIIEDTAELQCKSPNQVTLRATDQVDMLRLLKSTMRLRPDRILVGEVRGPEALALLKAWNTGHPGGLATVHADDGPLGLLRLEELVSEASITPRHQTIARTVHYVIFIEKTAEGRRVKEIVSVQGHDGTGYITTNEE